MERLCLGRRTMTKMKAFNLSVSALCVLGVLHSIALESSFLWIVIVSLSCAVNLYAGLVD